MHNEVYISIVYDFINDMMRHIQSSYFSNMVYNKVEGFAETYYNAARSHMMHSVSSARISSLNRIASMYYMHKNIERAHD